MTIRVAVTGISGDVGLGAIRGLRAETGYSEDIWILGLDVDGDCRVRHMVEGFATLPHVSDPHYIDALAAQLRAHAIDILLPGIDSEIMVLSRARERFAGGPVRIAIATPDLVEAADDKLATTRYLRARKIGAPETCDASNPADLGFPIIAKPRRGNGSKGVLLLRDAESLDSFLTEARPGYCLQEYIDGPEITVGFLYDWNGIFCDAIAMERTLAEGRTVRATVTRVSEILRFIEDFGDRVRSAGAVNAQLRISPARGVQVFEINARLSGSTAMRVAVGFNDPLRIVHHLARGEPMKPATVRQATVYRVPTGLVE